VSRAAVIELGQLPPGKRNTLIVACQHRVQDWMRELQRRTASGRMPTSSERRSLPTCFSVGWTSVLCRS
jgi:hypothetical protein